MTPWLRPFLPHLCKTPMRNTDWSPQLQSNPPVSNFQDVVDFQTKYGIEMASSPKLLDMDMSSFRLRFLNEELDETASAYLRRDMPEFFDGLLDLVYVAAGTAAIFGFDWWLWFGARHEALMRTVQPEYNLLVLDTGLSEFTYVQDYTRLAFRGLPVVPRWPASERFVTDMLDTMGAYVENVGGGYINDDLDFMARNLGALAYDAMLLAAVCSLPWQRGWNAVQTANMKKVRVDRAENSKRNSAFDVVKPEGWMAPDIKAVLISQGWED